MSPRNREAYVAEREAAIEAIRVRALWKARRTFWFFDADVSEVGRLIRQVRAVDEVKP